jgi:hypothetical protein
MSGLGGLALTPLEFERSDMFDPANPVYAEKVVASIA